MMATIDLTALDVLQLRHAVIVRVGVATAQVVQLILVAWIIWTLLLRAVAKLELRIDARVKWTLTLLLHTVAKLARVNLNGR